MKALFNGETIYSNTSSQVSFCIKASVNSNDNKYCVLLSNVVGATFKDVSVVLSAPEVLLSSSLRVPLKHS